MEKVIASLTEEQVAWLKQEAQRLGITVSEVLRHIVDSARGVKWPG